MTTEDLAPAAAESAIATSGGGEIVLPQVIVDAEPAAVRGARPPAGRQSRRSTFRP